MENRLAKVDFLELIPRNGFVFRFIKKDNDYIHTFVEGAFMTDYLTPTAMVIGHTLLEFLPERQALQKLAYYERAWNGENVTYEGNIDDVYYVASLNPIVHDGEVVEVIGTAFDITDQKRNEARIQELEKLSVVGELAAGVAHEIRNPLTSLIGFTQVLKERDNDDPMQSYLDIMMDELGRINTIIDKFMFIAQPEKTVDMRVHSINSIISHVIECLQEEEALKGIPIVFDEEASISAECDRSLITNVLHNLLENALEATEHNRDDIKITLKDLSLEHYVIQIIDKGAGMTDERLKKIFEPFYTTKEKGTGLGLMINRRIIELHKGTIDFKSELGKGTEVKITLPKSLH